MERRRFLSGIAASLGLAAVGKAEAAPPTRAVGYTEKRVAKRDIELAETFHADRSEGEEILYKQVFEREHECAYLFVKYKTGEEIWIGNNTTGLAPTTVLVSIDFEKNLEMPVTEATMYHTHPTDRKMPSSSELPSFEDLIFYTIHLFHKLADNPNMNFFDFRVVVPSGIFILKLKDSYIEEIRNKKKAHGILSKSEIAYQLSPYFDKSIDDTKELQHTRPEHAYVAKRVINEKNIKINSMFAERTSENNPYFELKFQPHHFLNPETTAT